MRRALACLAGILALLGSLAASAQAAAPLYDVKATWAPTALPPGGKALLKVQVRNIGDGAGEEEFSIVDELPAGLTVQAISWLGHSDLCSGVGTPTATCTLPESEASLLPSIAPAATLKNQGSVVRPEPSGYLFPVFIEAKVAAEATGTVTNTARVIGGGAPEATDIDQVSFAPPVAPFGVVPGSFLADVFKGAYPSQALSRQAGDHPFEQRFSFDLSAKAETSLLDGTLMNVPSGSVRTVEGTLPRGLIGNPQTLPKCDPLQFIQDGVVPNSTACAANTQVGYINAAAFEGPSDHGEGFGKGNASAFLTRIPIYNLIPPKGTPVDLAFNASGLVQVHIYATLDPTHDYAIKALTPNVSSLVGVLGSELTIWGVPGDLAHDRFRYYPEDHEGFALGAPFSAPIRPFFTNPMDCGAENGGTRIRLDSYNHPGEYAPTQENPNPLEVSGCADARFRFDPEVSLQPTDRHAGAPTGLDVHLQVPQRTAEVKDAADLYADNHSVNGIGTPPIKKVVVTLPEGMTLNPSAAQGLASCSLAEVGLGSNEPARCPDASQYGTLTLHTPALPPDSQPEGWIYIAKQSDNPFHNFLSLYLVIEEPDTGIRVKLAGKAELDPRTGQITTTFDDLPQFPVSDVQLSLKGGVRAGLVEPSTCGQKTINAEFYSWHNPTTPVPVSSFYQVTEKPDGSPCAPSLATRPFAPAFDAGTTNNTAGRFAPFVSRLTRTDDDQEISRLSFRLPRGLTGKAAGLGRCSDAAIAKAALRTGAGDGALEQADPSCLQDSYIGATEAGTGVGVPLTYVPGKLYLAGPYQGAPVSVVAITPAVVGPFDIGVIVVRSRLTVDPITAEVTATTDVLPQIFQGIPVRIRDLRLRLDRSEFTINPTGCQQKQIAAHLTGTGGDLFSAADDTGADLSARFQAADCAALAFSPKLSFRLFGGTHRGANPRLRAVVRGRGPGDANIAKASVALPHSEFLDQSHIGTVCTRVQFAAQSCPAASVYGHVKAKSPLFDEVFEGPIFLRSSSHPLPDLVAALRGPASLPVEIDLAGRIDSIHGGIRNAFDLVPDAPVSWAVFDFKGGKKGILVNSTDLCARAHRATAKFEGQNGRTTTLRPVLRASCPNANGRHRLHSR